MASQQGVQVVVTGSHHDALPSINTGDGEVYPALLLNLQADLGADRDGLLLVDGEEERDDLPGDQVDREGVECGCDVCGLRTPTTVTILQLSQPGGGQVQAGSG